MKHATVTDEQRDLAALFALGALPADEAAAFQAHLDAGCPVCQAEVDGFTDVTDDLALAAPPVAPGPEVRARLLAGVARPTFEFVMNDEGEWLPVAPGVDVKYLAHGPGIRSQSYLVRAQPKSRVPPHRHASVEHCLVLSGHLHIAGRDLHAGDFHLAADGSTHDDAYSEDGCLLLIVEAA